MLPTVKAGSIDKVVLPNVLSMKIVNTELLLRKGGLCFLMAKVSIMAYSTLTKLRWKDQKEGGIELS